MKTTPRLLLFTAIAIIVSGCARPPVPSNTPITSISPTFTATPLPTSTPLPSATPTQAPTSTPVKLAYKTINSGNIGYLAPIKSLGLGGAPLYIGYTPDGKQILLVSESSLCRIDSVTFVISDCSMFPPNFPLDFIMLARVNYGGLQDGSIMQRGLGTSVAFLPELSRLAISSGGVWDTSTMEQVSLSAKGDFVSLSPNGAYKLICARDQSTRILNTELIEVKSNSSLHTFEEYCLTSYIATQTHSFSPDSSRLVVFKDNLAELWDIAANQLVDSYTGSGKLTRVEFSPDGIYLAMTTDRTIDIFQVADHERVFTYTGAGRIRDFSFSPNGQYLAVVSMFDAAIKIWKVSDWSRVYSLIAGAAKGFDGVRFSPNSDYIYASQPSPSQNSYEQAFYDVWDMVDGKLLLNVAGQGDISLASLSPDGRQFFYVDEYEYHAADVVTGESLFTYPLNVGGDPVVSPRGDTIASGIKGGAIAVWNTTDGSLIRTIGEIDSSKLVSFSYQFPIGTTDIQYSPDGRMIASGLNDGQIEVWNVADGTLVKILRPKSGILSTIDLAFSPDGLMLAGVYSAGPNSPALLYLWSVPDGKILLQTSEGRRNYNQVWFSTDGHFLGLSEYFKGIGKISRKFAVQACPDNPNVPLPAPGCDVYTESDPASLSLGTGGLQTKDCNYNTSGVYRKAFSSLDNDIVALLYNACGVQFYDRNTGKLVSTVYQTISGFARSPDSTFYILSTFNGDGLRVFGIKR